MSGGGTVLGGRYRLVERIGGGGMGSVWRAEDEVLGRQVAVKVLHRALFEEGTFAARFKREAQLLAALRHPGIVDVHDYGEGEEESGERAAFIVMELVEGRPLNEVLADGGPMGAERALGLLASALDALEAAHRRGIVHRDLKPSNLMLRGDDRLTVTDFGIARALASSRITASHTVLGTALYMAPEQAEGAATTPASDLYSIGVVCYELLTGEPPFLGESVLEVALKHIRDPAPELPSGVPPAVRELVAKALAKRPEDRFADAAAMAAAARAALADGAAASAPTVRVPPAPVPALPVAGDGPVADEVPAAKDAPAAGARDEVAPGRATPAPGTPKDAPGADGPGAVTERSGRRSRRRLLVPFVVPVIITAGTGTVLLIDRPSYRADANAPGPQQSAPASGAPAGPAGTGTASAGAPAPTPTDPAAQATAVPSAAVPGTPGPATGPGAPGSPQPNAAGGGGTAGGAAAAGGTGGQGTTPRGGASTPAAGAPAPPAPAGQPAPAPTTAAPAPAVPQGCGGTDWGAIVNVGDNLKIGLAKDGPAAGTAAVMGGYTAYGWVHSVPSSWHHFNPCNMNAPEFVQTTDGKAALSDGFSFLANWKVDPATTSGAVLLKDYMGSKCLTDNGAGNQLTMAACTPGNKAQEWRIP
ncbi:hypothetical protein GCM10018781_53770 [Kitasatospora indigofera]|uniref:non-specific serine/threonine protein kinase n=1 Tax=Kitasatospora indigofera TaxID=67307 RepID=A0A919G4V4_9ACTN|nr:serine/threonine-protein kinase [Kitasatospora indigofera]GHH78292.1 hypothetical protein GCM10018781_53770 [Kitasatospora indigofera]